MVGSGSREGAWSGGWLAWWSGVVVASHSTLRRQFCHAAKNSACFNKTLKKIYSFLFYVYEHLPAFIYVPCVSLMLEEATRFLGKGVTDGCELPPVPGTEPRSSVRATSALSQAAISPTPSAWFKPLVHGFV